MFIVDKTDTSIASDHSDYDYNSTETSEEQSSCLSSPYKFRRTIYPQIFFHSRSLHLIFYLSIITSSKIIAIKGEKICPEMRVKESNGITCDIKKDILEAHNDMRQAVAAGLIDRQPSASNMRELYWDDELAQGAQNWADHCTFKHNAIVDRRTSKFFQVGQNLGLTKNINRAPDEKEFRKLIKKWFGEHAVYDFDDMDRSGQQITGHYTQLVWAETFLVGCGYSRFEHTISNVSYRLYVCHYGPSGNVRDEEPYEKGSRKCPENTIPSRKYNALCALESPPKDNCSESMGQFNKELNKEQQVFVNGRRSEWFQKSERADENRRFLQSRKSLSTVGLRNRNIDSFGSPDKLTFIILRIMIRLR